MTVKTGRNKVVVSPEFAALPGGSRRTLVEITLAIMEVSQEAMAVCGPDARTFATNAQFRELQEQIGEPLNELVARAVAGDANLDDLADAPQQLAIRVASIGTDDPAEMFIVALSDQSSEPTLSSRMLRALRESLESALRAIDEPMIAAASVLDPSRPLTRKEGEVFKLLAAGLRVSSIARTLHVSESTVRSHLKAIFRKSGVRSQAGLFEKLHQLQPESQRSNASPSPE